MAREREQEQLSQTFADRAPDRRLSQPIPPPKELKPEPPFVMIGSVADLGTLGPQVTRIHLKRQGVIKAAVVADIIRRCPDLEVLRIPPSFERLAMPGVRQELASADIELRFGRARDAGFYNTGPLPPEYPDRQRRFKQLLRTKQGRQTLAAVRKHHLPEAELAKMYFLGKRVSQRVIAQELGQPYSLVAERLGRVTRWFGLDQEKAHISPELVAKLAQLENRQRSAQERAQQRESIKVGETYPPSSLPTNRWQNWHLIELTRQKYPDQYNQLTRKYPRAIRAAELYYQISTATKYSWHTIGQEFFDRRTGEDVRQQGLRALRLLRRLQREPK